MTEELFTSTKSINNIRLYERLGYKIFNWPIVLILAIDKIFKQEAVSQELQFMYLQKCRNTR